MIHLQYYNSVLKNNHINKILNNYKIKYSRFVNEIESKVNEMMKLYLKDILTFLENIEEVADQKHKLAEYDKNKKELELIKQKLKSKTYNEHKMKTDYDLLQQENNLLKLKINSLNQKITNLKNINVNSSQNSTISPEKTYSNRFNKSMPKIAKSFMSPRYEKDDDFYLAVNTTSILDENNKENKTILALASPKSKHMKSNLGKIDKPKQNNKNNNINNNNNPKKKINANKFINNNKDTKSNKSSKKNIKLSINTNSNNSIRKSYNKKNETLSSKSGPIIKKFKNNNKNNKNSNNNINNNVNDIEINNVNIYSPLNTFSQTIDFTNINLNINYEDLGKKVDEAFDSELKELEQDEANIELLLGQLTDEDDNENDNNNEV